MSGVGGVDDLDAGHRITLTRKNRVSGAQRVFSIRFKAFRGIDLAASHARRGALLGLWLFGGEVVWRAERRDFREESRGLPSIWFLIALGRNHLDGKSPFCRLFGSVSPSNGTFWTANPRFAVRTVSFHSQTVPFRRQIPLLPSKKNNQKAHPLRSALSAFVFNN